MQKFHGKIKEKKEKVKQAVTFVPYMYSLTFVPHLALGVLLSSIFKCASPYLDIGYLPCCLASFANVH